MKNLFKIIFLVCLSFCFIQKGIAQDDVYYSKKNTQAASAQEQPVRSSNDKNSARLNDNYQAPDTEYVYSDGPNKRAHKVIVYIQVGNPYGYPQYVPYYVPEYYGLNPIYYDRWVPRRAYDPYCNPGYYYHPRKRCH